MILGVGTSGSKPVVVIATTSAARESGNQAGKLVGLACRELGGGGGGKPDLAQGGGSDVDAIPAAVAAVKAALQ